MLVYENAKYKAKDAILYLGKANGILMLVYKNAKYKLYTLHFHTQAFKFHLLFLNIE